MHQYIGDQLKKARESRKMRQEDMALKLGISSRQYQKYEDGEFPKFKTEPIKQIDAILGTNIYEQVYEQEVQKGEIKKPTPVEGEGLKDDLIAALKMNNALLESRVRELEARPATSADIESHLSRIREDQKQMFSLLVSYQQHWLKQQLHNPKKFAEALRSIQQNALEDQEQLLQQGKAFFEGTNDNSKS
jgi:transcriptional regulator with XRE-family HTH domain